MQFGLVGYPYEDVFHTLPLVCEKRGFKIKSADYATGIIHATKRSGIFFSKSDLIMKAVRVDGISTRIEIAITKRNKENMEMENRMVDTIYHFF